MQIIAVFSHGCNVRGPYTAHCLKSAWSDAGCLENGHRAPHNLTLADLDHYNKLDYA